MVLLTKKIFASLKKLLEKGPDASKSQTAAEKSKSGTLADILKKLGLTPKIIIKSTLCKVECSFL